MNIKGKHAFPTPKDKTLNMGNAENSPRKPAPRALKVLFTLVFGGAVIGIMAIAIGLFSNQASTLIIGMVILGVAGLLGIFVMNLMFPKKRR